MSTRVGQPNGSRTCLVWLRLRPTQPLQFENPAGGFQVAFSQDGRMGARPSGSL